MTEPINRRYTWPQFGSGNGMKPLTILELEYKEDSSVYFEQFLEWPYPCFLDSSAFNGKTSVYKNHFGRYDIITAAPAQYFTSPEQGSLIIEDLSNAEKRQLSTTSPMTYLSDCLQQLSPVEDSDLPFTGGLMGFWSYELCEQLEAERIAGRQTHVPHLSVGLYHWAVICDHKTRSTSVVFHPDIAPSLQQRVLAQLDVTSPLHGQPSQTTDAFKLDSFQLTAPFQPTQTREAYHNAFQVIQNYITAGDCYEVNLTQRFTAPYLGDTWQAYKHLRTQTLAPYSAYIKRPEMTILSHSPEQFLRLENRTVTTNPIKGTRPRGSTSENDKAIANELLNSPKDQAENLMIVDLLRNDLGRVCKTGSIHVPRLFALESYANVHHLVSTVTGQLADDQSPIDLLRHAFPGGSITGAPKIRSMEIIRELEPLARTIYCGAIGYINGNGNMDTSITIRTLLAHNGELHCWGAAQLLRIRMWMKNTKNPSQKYAT